MSETAPARPGSPLHLDQQCFLVYPPAVLILPFPPSSCTIFCDETAHSGPNWLDRQPFYVTAAWIVRDENLNVFRNRALHLSESLQLQSDDRELKGRHFRNNKRRQKLALQWFRSIRNDDQPLAFPAYYIVERRFGACGKIADLLLDPVTNEAAAWLPTGDFEQREKITETIYAQCPSETLVSFCEALSKPSPSSWRIALSGLAGVNWPDPLLQGGLNSANGLADELFDAEFGHYLDQGRNPALPHSPNYFSFRHVLQSADLTVRNMWPGCSAHVVHDEQVQYSRYFDDIFELTSGIGEIERRRGEMLPELIGGLHAIKEFRMERSDNEVGIQSADLLSWLIYQIVAAICGDVSAAHVAHENEFFDEIIGPFLMCDRNARMHASWSKKSLMWEKALAIHQARTR